MSHSNHAKRLREIASDLLGMDSDSADVPALLAGAEAIECLKDIMDSLPRNRDWLDPVTEKRARDVCAEMDRLLPKEEPNR